MMLYVYGVSSVLKHSKRKWCAHDKKREFYANFISNVLLLNMFTVGGSHVRLSCLKGANSTGNGFCRLAPFLYALNAWLRVSAVNICFCAVGVYNVVE